MWEGTELQREREEQNQAGCQTAKDISTAPN